MNFARGSSVNIIKRVFIEERVRNSAKEVAWVRS
jgi:hypothetical protein